MRGSLGRNRSRNSSTRTSENLTIHPTMRLLGLTAKNASPTRSRSTTAKRAPTSRAVAASAFMIVCTTRPTRTAAPVRAGWSPTRTDDREAVVSPRPTSDGLAVPAASAVRSSEAPAWLRSLSWSPIRPMMRAIGPAEPGLRLGSALRQGFLQRPAVAVGIGEVHEATPRLLVDRADRDPSGRQLSPRGIGVGDHRQQALLRSRSHLRDALADHDRARRARRRELHEAQFVADALVVVGVEPDLVDVEGLGAVDVGDGNRHELEFHLHEPTLASTAVIY